MEGLAVPYIGEQLRQKAQNIGVIGWLVKQISGVY